MKMITMLFSFLVFCSIGFSQSIFLDAGPLQGDAPEGQPVLAYSFGASNSGSAHVGGGIGSGKPNFQDISLSMLTGKMSTELLKSVALGTHFPEMKLKFYDNKKMVFYQITLKEVMVTSYQQGTACGKTPCTDLTESITLTYGQIKIEDFSNNKEFQYNLATVSSLIQ